MPSDGVASRMLLSTICMNITSNCLEACFMPSCGELRTVRRKASTPCTSSDKRWSSTPAAGEFMLLRLAKPALFMSTSDDLEFCAQGAHGLHGLQDGHQILRIGAQRVEPLDHVSQRGATTHDLQRATRLADFDLRALGRHRAAARERSGLADDRLGIDHHRQIA